MEDCHIPLFRALFIEQASSSVIIQSLILPCVCSELSAVAAFQFIWDDLISLLHPCVDIGRTCTLHGCVIYDCEFLHIRLSQLDYVIERSSWKIS